MILERLDASLNELELSTGWAAKSEGAGKGDRCVPLPSPPTNGRLDVRVLAEHVGMPLIYDDRHRLWVLGPESGGPVLRSSGDHGRQVRHAGPDGSRLGGRETGWPSGYLEHLRGGSWKGRS